MRLQPALNNTFCPTTPHSPTINALQKAKKRRPSASPCFSFQKQVSKFPTEKRITILPIK